MNAPMTDREEFEVWVIRHWRGRGFGAMLTDAEMLKRDPDGRYQAYEGEWQGWQAALASHPNTPRPIFIENVPSVEGWKLVPIEPTLEMIAAPGMATAMRSGSAARIYRAMLEAAPLPGENPRGGPLKFGR